MEKSESIKELFEALSKAQGQIEGAKKDAKNPKFNSKYSDLAAVWAVARGPLEANGLSVSQFPSMDNEKVSVETVLGHSSGQWMSGILTMIPLREKKGEGFSPSTDPHTIGKTISYLRRYSLAALLGIYQEDDDGNAGSKGDKPDKIKEPSRNGNPKEEPKGKTNNFEFLKIMGQEKIKMAQEFGESGYYDILKRFGFSHANEIQKRDDQIKVFEALEGYLESAKETS